MQIEHWQKEFEQLFDSLKKMKAKEILLENNLKKTSNSLKIALDKVENQENELNELKNQIKILKLATALASDEKDIESSVLKRKVTEYIKEIDQCIAMLKGGI